MNIKILAALAVIMGFTAACSTAGSNGKSIQGTWHYSQGGSPGMSLDWKFDGTNYDLHGYPELHRMGRYRVLESEGPTLRVLLYENKGDQPPEDRKISITIGKGGQTLTIDNQGPWTKAP